MPEQVWMDTWHVKPGRMEDYLGVIEQFDGIMTRLDVRPTFHNAVQELSGPGESGFLTVHHSFGYDSFEAYGKAFDAFFADEGFLELFNGVLGADGPAVSRSGASGQFLFRR